MKIAIIDDSDLMRDRVRELVNTNSEVVIVGEAKNGVEALLLLRETEPDLAILDIRMPELNGIAVLKKIKAGNSKTKICILTNFPYAQYRNKCIAEGADYFLDKNADLNKIPGLIAELVRNQNGEANE